eukprot:gnl/TRDRNA2_/TRDRNA2_165073_c0_seq1.p2 gnl/TRDRNA2_/TRDRNA2_165073_c0~~gnl/TRDRNA2_/TRDRNA2_165073_c0_seq1.p2  ORF type:complete len:115 (-),score=10.25 gnl/TRDRNA2_/TRDRNA2_165073_c0_seq1:134-478(-)
MLALTFRRCSGDPIPGALAAMLLVVVLFVLDVLDSFPKPAQCSHQACSDERCEACYRKDCYRVEVNVAYIHVLCKPICPCAESCVLSSCMPPSILASWLAAPTRPRAGLWDGLD